MFRQLTILFGCSMQESDNPNKHHKPNSMDSPTVLGSVTPDTNKTNRTQTTLENYSHILLRPSIFLRRMYTTEAYDFLKESPSTVSVKDVAFRLFTLIYVNKFASDKAAFDWPIFKAIQSFNNTTKNHADVRFLNNFLFLAAAPRRIGKDDNGPLYEVTEKGKFKQKCFITCIPNNTPAAKQNLLESFALVRIILLRSVLCYLLILMPFSAPHSK